MSEVRTQASRAAIISYLREDPEFLIQFFLGDELTLPVPDIHIEVFALMTHEDVDRFVCAIPRDHAKTTIAKLAVIWYLLFSDYRFVVYMSCTTTIAIPATNDIVNFLEGDNFKSVFGNVRWIKKQDGIGHYEFEIIDGNGDLKYCILKAMSAGQQVRGLNIDNRRPDLAILDDIEDNKNIATEELFRGLKQWFYGPFKKALNKFHNKIIHLGNMIADKSLLNEHCKSEYWFSRHYGCILADGTALWPDAWPIEKLIRDYQEYQEAGMADVWFAEMMNLPLAGGRGLIRAEEIYYLPRIDPGNHEYGFITIDLAITDKTWAHKTVAAVHVWNGDCWQVAEYQDFMGIDPVSLFRKIIPMCEKWNIRVVGIEDAAYQASLKFMFRHLCMENNIPVSQDIHGEGMLFVPLKTNNQQKTQRIAPWAGMIKGHQYALTEGDFSMTQQLLSYNPQKKNNDDDFIDCGAYGIQMIDVYLLQIMEDSMPMKELVAQTGYSVCSI